MLEGFDGALPIAVHVAKSGGNGERERDDDAEPQADPPRAAHAADLGAEGVIVREVRLQGALPAVDEERRVGNRARDGDKRRQYQRAQIVADVREDPAGKKHDQGDDDGGDGSADEHARRVAPHRRSSERARRTSGTTALFTLRASAVCSEAGSERLAPNSVFIPMNWNATAAPPVNSR